MKNLQQIEINNEKFYKITDSDKMRPFLMSIVSDGNHWMFISSNGGLTAGRKNAEHALFPYYTDDKITESAETTGSKSIFRINNRAGDHLWEPFSYRGEGRFSITRNLYKSVYGNKIAFEEINHDLGLSYRYQWSTSGLFGFVRTSTLSNEKQEAVNVSMIDGLQNILPSEVGSYLQNNTSNLVDAYKRSELHPPSGLGIYALSAVIVDKAEPSEALKANTVWSMGLRDPLHLVSSLQLEAFRRGDGVTSERDVKGERGAYLLHQQFTLQADEATDWTIVANVNQDHASVAQLIESLGSPAVLYERLRSDVAIGTTRLVGLSAAADGLQLSADQRRDTRHFSNVLFNIMRGGIFDHNYDIDREDFAEYLRKANKEVASKHGAKIAGLPEVFQVKDLQKIAGEASDPDFIRLCQEYLPLKFSRRHGDPSRPWNRFSINTNSEVDGSKILDYEGNWRDIFQNWEALAHSYPDFMEGMIAKFLNASTFEGYNPYRVTKGGFDWEALEADDPWSYIGYWGDHQIIYLLKFLEFQEKHLPGALAKLFGKENFVFANVPYRIKAYADILKDPKDTVDFDHELDTLVRERRDELGADGALLRNRAGKIHRANLVEKLLITVLAKVANFIPGGGIWMNTQRPEWNDANNALVGNGVSMVTLYYLHRFLKFLGRLLEQADSNNYQVSIELGAFFTRIQRTLEEHKSILTGPISDQERRNFVDGLGEAASSYRLTIYEDGYEGKSARLSVSDLRKFCTLCLAYFDHTIKANRRTDDLYHSYNLVTVGEDDMSISYLSEMLEGQVAVLSGNCLEPGEALTVMDALKASRLFREDQYSYLLYPNKQLPGFLEKNTVPVSSIQKSKLLKRLVQDGDRNIIIKDTNGAHHFNGNFNNVKDLRTALDAIETKPYEGLVEQDRKLVESIFEEVFNHKEFTGRSGTFYGYEGLGSIYWHMVSKLQLAVQENCLGALNAGPSLREVADRMVAHYYEILEGTGVHKSPELYGAFPTDPYSHTPAGKGAQQPGMTGQVKEDILNRFGELGIQITGGRLSFSPTLLRRDEFLEAPKTFHFVTTDAEEKEIELAAGSLGFTYCQVPVSYILGDQASIKVIRESGPGEAFDGTTLSAEASREVFGRTGQIQRIEVTLDQANIR